MKIKTNIIFKNLIYISNIVILVKLFKSYLKKLNKVFEQSNRNEKESSVFNLWLKYKQENINLKEYFEDRKLYNIALYGMNNMSLRLCQELKDTGINIKYGIVHGGTHINTDLKIYSLDEKFPNVDAIIVMCPYDYENINKQLHKKINCKIISIEDVVFKL